MLEQDRRENAQTPTRQREGASCGQQCAPTLQQSVRTRRAGCGACVEKKHVAGGGTARVFWQCQRARWHMCPRLIRLPLAHTLSRPPPPTRAQVRTHTSQSAKNAQARTTTPRRRQVRTTRCARPHAARLLAGTRHKLFKELCEPTKVRTVHCLQLQPAPAAVDEHRHGAEVAQLDHTLTQRRQFAVHLLQHLAGGEAGAAELLEEERTHVLWP